MGISLYLFFVNGIFLLLFSNIFRKLGLGLSFLNIGFRIFGKLRDESGFLKVLKIVFVILEIFRFFFIWVNCWVGFFNFCIVIFIIGRGLILFIRLGIC